MQSHLKTRRVGFVALLAAAVVAVIVLPAAGGSTTSNHLDLDIVAVNPGPLTTCSEDGSNCGLANTVRHFIQVANTNSLPSRLEPGGPTRSMFPNSFVVDRIDETIFVDGVETYHFFYTPPPDTNYPPYVGHWPATAACPPEGPPCNVVTSPAVMPGERTLIFWTGWGHGDEEPNGLYVFRYTVHGTLNGTPVDISANSPPIRMID